MSKGKQGFWDKFFERFGIKNIDDILRPIPEFSFRPDYWLGALLVVGFVMQGITGFLLLLNYIPTPTDAYSSTSYIVNNTPFGSLLLNFHLYNAYAIIFLAFVHMFRNFWQGTYKRPREGMWIVGVILGLITLGFGFTGYLLPWTVLSKSATDVGIGLLSYLPSWMTSWLHTLLVGNGTDAEELQRFFDIHVILLPILLVVFLGLKLFMFEAHGMSEPPKKGVVEEIKNERKGISWWPKGVEYLLTISLFYIAIIIIIASAFPVPLGPMYTPQAASHYTPEPDWYFLWMYQIIKQSIFGGKNIVDGIYLIGLLFIILLIVPFIDRSPLRHVSDRPVIATLGMMVVSTLVFFTIWAYLTPGLTIQFTQTLEFLIPMYLVEAIGAYLGTRSSKMKSNKKLTKSKPNSVVAIIALLLSIVGGSLSINLIVSKDVSWGIVSLLSFTFIVVEIMRRSHAEV